jgi:predicted NBD/HSP70 family sugar kinase
MKPQLPGEWRHLRNTLDSIEGAAVPPSRANIAERLSLSRTTASTLVSRLISLGLIEETGSAVNGRGRPGIPLKISTRHWYALGAAFQGNEWMFLTVDLTGAVVREHSEKVDSFGVEEVMKSLLRGLAFMIKRKPGSLLPLIGIGVPGLVNSDTGEIIRADDMEWRRVALGELVFKRTGIPARVMNRNRASGLAELRFGAGQNIKNLVYIGIGTGISAAIINNGILLEGTNFSAGEIGHTLVDPSGPLCGCGKRGCLQAMASSPALVQAARELYRSMTARGKPAPPNPLWNILQDHSLVSGELIGAEANDGNPAAIVCMRKIAGALGVVVANLINLLNPQKIIIGGTLGNTGPLLTRLIAREAGQYAMATPFSAAAIERSQLGNRAGALGATCLPLQYKLELLLRRGKTPAA